MCTWFGHLTLYLTLSFRLPNSSVGEIYPSSNAAKRNRACPLLRPVQGHRRSAAGWRGAAVWYAKLRSFCCRVAAFKRLCPACSLARGFAVKECPCEHQFRQKDLPSFRTAPAASAITKAMDEVRCELQRNPLCRAPLSPTPID